MVPKKRAFYFFSFLAIFIVVIPFILLYSLGYRFTKNYELAERGGLYVFVPESNSEIYVNDELRDVTSTFQKEMFLQNLKPATYLVLVSNDLFWPWAKYVDVSEREVSPLYPLLVPKRIDMREVTVATSTQASSTRVTKNQYAQLVRLFETKQTASVATSSVSTSTPHLYALMRKKMKVWAQDADIYAQWTGDESRIPPYFCMDDVCDPNHLVLHGSSVVRHIDFYPGRDDAVIIAVAEGIFALEFDTRKYQNFYTLYKGERPDFRVFDGTVYVRDMDVIYELINI